jgi:D-sedoheptulose 7-phosphate isomerase
MSSTSSQVVTLIGIKMDRRPPRSGLAGKLMSVTFSEEFLAQSAELLRALDAEAIEATALGLADVRARGGRLFILGVGGSAGHASHAVNDFRKICGFEAYAPTDNVSELTARTNDEGWDTTFVEWLRGSRLDAPDAILVFSVGGGDAVRGVSVNIVRAIDLAVEVGASVFGVVGRDGGHTAQRATACVIVPPLFPNRITPHTEGLCAVIWHLLVSHPALARSATKWESI